MKITSHMTCILGFSCSNQNFSILDLGLVQSRLIVHRNITKDCVMRLAQPANTRSEEMSKYESDTMLMEKWISLSLQREMANPTGFFPWFDLTCWILKFPVQSQLNHTKILNRTFPIEDSAVFHATALFLVHIGSTADMIDVALVVMQKPSGIFRRVGLWGGRMPRETKQLLISAEEYL